MIMLFFDLQFCDGCKAGVPFPTCDLCPNSGGIFKQTNVGRWVHVVCAQYIPTVRFDDTIHFTGTTLFEIPAESWGAKACSLCEDSLMARTGITISCDAGLCKTHFHATCAQKEGLLIHEEGEIDPYYAHCKLHAGADKSLMKRKKRNLLSFNARMKFKMENPVKMNERSVQKLEKARHKYQKDRLKYQNVIVPSEKRARMLTTSPYAVKMLTKKAELLGFPQNSQLLAAHDLLDVRKKWHVPPSLNLEFVGYFLDRDSRMISMNQKIDQLKSQNQQLIRTSETTRRHFEIFLQSYENLKKESGIIRDGAKSFVSKLSQMSRHKIKIPKLLETPVKENLRKDGTPKKSMNQKHNKNNHRMRKFSISTGGTPSSSQVIGIQKCGLCQDTKDQHMMAYCDNCKLHYHFKCLDPPLTRMPKRNRFGGWMCSECTEKEQKAYMNPEVPDTDEPKGKRGIKTPRKFIPELKLYKSKVKKGRPKGSKTGAKNKKIKLENGESAAENNASGLDGTTSPSTVNNTPKVKPVKIKKEPKGDQKCCKCKITSAVSGLVE